jgi:protein-serine/threonine kinase
MPYISPVCPSHNARNCLRFETVAKISRNTQTTLLSADTTFSSGLRRIRSSQLSLASLLDGQPVSSKPESVSPSIQPMLSSQHNMLTSTEDLTKFPSESLHSFSFSQPKDPAAILESRQNVLRKSIDYMKDKLHGLALSTPWTDSGFLTSSPPSTPAVPKDEDVLQSLKKANLIPDYWDETNLPPPTAPLNIVEDPFDIMEIEPLAMGSHKKRTPTDLSAYKFQAKLFDAVTRPYSINTSATTPAVSPVERRLSMQLLQSQHPGGVPVHSTSRLAPTMQAIFSTEVVSPWRILNANDLACLEFDIGEQGIKKGISILECFEPGRREFIQERLKGTTPAPSDIISLGDSESTKDFEEDDKSKDDSKERVLLCGEVVNMRKMKDHEPCQRPPIAASLWVKEKVFVSLNLQELI